MNMRDLANAGRHLTWLLFAGSMQLWAATITVDSVDDPGDGNCLTNGCTLREAVAEASTGDEIVFDVLSGGATMATITLSGSAITLEKALTVTGTDGVRIDGNEQSGIFVVSGAGSFDVEMSDLVLENGSAQYGGAIDNSESLSLIDVEFLNNQAVSAGGAIDSTGGLLTVRSCLFQGNEVSDPAGASTNGGGAIHSFGSVAVYGSEFLENQALNGKFGGAIYFSNATATLELTFSHPMATRFKGNAAAGSGGAIAVAQAARVDGFLVDFDGNTAAEGGGIWVAEGVPEVELISNLFVNNSADRGGAIFSSSRLDVLSGAFNGNSVTGDGGAIWHGSSPDSTIARTLFTDNSSDRGGAILNDADGVLTIENSTFSANNANSDSTSAGGAIFNLGVPLPLRNVSLANNIASGPGDALSGGFEVVNTIVSGPSPADNCTDAGTTVSSGHNIDNGASCGFDQNSDFTSTDPWLEPLTSGVRFKRVHLPAADSPAIDAGSDADCTANDQIGTLRPVDGDMDGVAVCDIGAAELDPLVFRDRFES